MEGHVIASSGSHHKGGDNYESRTDSEVRHVATRPAVPGHVGGAVWHLQRCPEAIRPTRCRDGREREHAGHQYVECEGSDSDPGSAASGSRCPSHAPRRNHRSCTSERGAGLQGAADARQGCEGGGADSGRDRDGGGGERTPAGLRGQRPSGELCRRPAGRGSSRARRDRLTGQEHNEPSRRSRRPQGERVASARPAANAGRTGEERAARRSQRAGRMEVGKADRKGEGGCNRASHSGERRHRFTTLYPLPGTRCANAPSTPPSPRRGRIGRSPWAGRRASSLARRSGKRS